MTIIKYQYALDSDGEITDVHTLSPDRRRIPSEFHCLSCGNELIPKLGEVRKWHFAHKTTVECSAETYLHRLGKCVFYSEYKKCLERKLPFRIRFNIGRSCTHLGEDEEELCDLGMEEASHDLTRYFPSILPPETPDGNFIPDITLVSRDGLEKLYVEIRVTHASSDDKLNSGTRIIEIDVASEDDLEAVRNHELDASRSNVTIHNFVTELSRDYCGGACKYRRAGMFIVFQSGKVLPLIDSLHGIQQTLSRSASKIVHSEPFPIPLDSKQFQSIVSSTWKRGIPIKNCFLCRYHVHGRYETIFCKFLRRGGSSNDAAECQYYRPDMGSAP